MKRWMFGLVGIVAVCTNLLAVSAAAQAASGGCTAFYVYDGPNTDGSKWFNLFGNYFKTSQLPVLTFSSPVVPWPTLQTDPTQPAITTFTVPADLMASLFKTTFRPQDAGIGSIQVTVSGLAKNGSECVASTVVNFDSTTPPTPFPTLPNTSTASTTSSGDSSSPVLPVALILIFAGGFVVSRRFLGRPS